MTLVNDIDTMLDTYEYQGFPIIHSDVDTSLVGYITRGDLLYAIVFFDNPDFGLRRGAMDSQGYTPLGVDSTVPIEFVITKAMIYSMDDMMSSVRLRLGSQMDVTLSADNTASSVRIFLAVLDL
ncbi:hypothetical protein BSLG_003605 [Batrachochytrium salamandrivorans]|nr:hypothetical protein BSLG_003605 [Batrachochytrium salamandrivorans]